MNRLFKQLVEKYNPRVNATIMEGLACEHMKLVEAYIHNVFKSAAKSFPAGFEYCDFERCTPEMEYYEVSKPRNNKRTFDIAQSDIYLLRYQFKFQGIELPKMHIYLPFVRDAGIMYLNGTMYHVTPVLSDKVISPGFDSVFVRLLRDKIIFRRLYHSLVINDVREMNYVIWSQIHRKPHDKKVEKTTKAETCVAHYLFAKYGFTETFKRYAGFVPIIGLDEINEERYPREAYVIVQSSQVKPRSHIGMFYEPCEIRMAIPAEHWTPLMKSLIIGFYYVVDHFPSRFKPEYVDNIDLWRILLGHVIFSGAYGENKLFTEMNEHFDSLDDYVDTIIIQKLKESHYHVNNFYDLLAVISQQFNSLVLDDSATLSMYDKSLEVLYYVLYDITAGIFRVNFGLGKLARNKQLNGKQITIDDVKKTLTNFIKPKAICNLASGKIVIEAVSYSGDHKYFKLTSKITEQESLPGAMRGKSKRFVLDQGKHLDPSMLEAGSILFLPKSNPTPANKINPYVMIDEATGTILRNPEFIEAIGELNRLYKGIYHDNTTARTD